MISQFITCYESHKSIVRQVEALVGQTDQVRHMQANLAGYGVISLDAMLISHTQLKTRLNREMATLYENFVVSFDGRKPQEVLDDVSSRLHDPNFCFTGGYGHRIELSTGPLSHHWCVKPAFYDTVRPSVYEKLVFQMMGHNVEVAEKAASERWGN